MRVSNHLIVGAMLALGLVLAESVPAAVGQSSRSAAAVSGKTRALLVFARFKDDAHHTTGCRANRGWPLTPDGLEPLPDFAHTLFSSSDSPPFPDSTVTEYFHQQSDHALTLYADVYPTVIVSDEEASYYRSASRHGYGHLAAEIFRKLDPNVDFRDYDNNPRDGVVDQVFIVLRRDEAGTFTGVAHLAGADRVRGRPPGDIVVDGVKVDWASSGSFIYNDRPGNVVPQSYHVRMVAHEYGHHIWNPRNVFAGHVPAIRNNDTPENDTNIIGYTLMAGRAGGRDGRGDLLISAPERDAIGWLDPLILRPDVDTTQFIQLGDLYSTGEAVRIDIPTPYEADRNSFYISNRQRIGWFDQYRLDAPEGCSAYEMGFLRTTGMLIMLTRWKRGRLSLDVLPADNTMNLSPENMPYEGDLFGPRSAQQITPFTTPSTSLPDGSPSWFAIDDIRMTGASDSSMSFVFIPDFRNETIIRENSRVDPDHGRVTIRGGLHVMNSSTFTVAPGSQIDISGPITADPGSSIVAQDGSTVTIDGVTRFVFGDYVIPVESASD